MYIVYILLSADLLHWYIGHSNNIIDRLRRHNSGESFSTKPYRPWQVVYTEQYETRSEAFKREMYLKSAKGYIDYKKIKEDILKKIKK